MTIWDIERKILNSAHLTPAEIHIVEQALGCETAPEKILACEALLRVGDAAQQSKALRVLAEIAKNVSSGITELTPEFVMATFNVPPPILTRQPFRQALEAAARHPDDGVRVNCMVALTPLAAIGEGWAHRLLELAMADTNSEVRQNARAGRNQKGFS